MIVPAMQAPPSAAAMVMFLVMLNNIPPAAAPAARLIIPCTCPEGIIFLLSYLFVVQMACKGIGKQSLPWS
jgi:hypothetical protein